MTLDGRNVRRERNRLAVVDATLELMRESRVIPSVDEITTRSGVSQRSIFRYFENLDDLRGAVLARNFEQVAPLVVLPRIGEGTLADRIRGLVNARVRVCEALAGPAQVARAQVANVPVLAEEIRRFRLLLDQQVRTHFASELSLLRSAEADDIALLANVVVSLESWELLTDIHGRSRAQIRRAWTRGLDALLAPSG